MTSPQGTPARECLLFGLCAIMTGQFNLTLRSVLTDHHPILAPGVTSTLLFVSLVGFMIAALFALAAPALPRPFREPTDPPPMAPSTTRFFTWSSWCFVVVPTLMLGYELYYCPPLWPLALFPVAGTVFAVLCTRVHRRERARILAQEVKETGR